MLSFPTNNSYSQAKSTVYLLFSVQQNTFPHAVFRQEMGGRGRLGVGIGKHFGALQVRYFLSNFLIESRLDQDSYWWMFEWVLNEVILLFIYLIFSHSFNLRTGSCWARTEKKIRRARIRSRRMSEAIGEGQGSLFAGYHSLYKSIQAGGVMMRIKIKILKPWIF